jgi:hypothetical protein
LLCLFPGHSAAGIRANDVVFLSETLNYVPGWCDLSSSVSMNWDVISILHAESMDEQNIISLGPVQLVILETIPIFSSLTERVDWKLI